MFKIEYYVLFEMLKKKIWANFQRIVEVFTQKIFNMLSYIWVWDPGIRDQGSGIRDQGSGIRDQGSGIRDQGSGIRDPRSGIRKKPIPDPGSRGQKGTGSRIRIRNTGFASLILNPATQLFPMYCDSAAHILYCAVQ
jgi:hypothetical protein